MKSWTCIENCGACCKFNLEERIDLADKLNDQDITLINSMTAKTVGVKIWTEKIKNA